MLALLLREGRKRENREVEMYDSSRHVRLAAKCIKVVHVMKRES